MASVIRAGAAFARSALVSSRRLAGVSASPPRACLKFSGFLQIWTWRPPSVGRERSRACVRLTVSSFSGNRSGDARVGASPLSTGQSTRAWPCSRHPCSRASHAGKL